MSPRPDDLAAAMGRAAKRTAPKVPRSRPPELPQAMSREARGEAPTWRTAEQAFPHSVPFRLDARRYGELRRMVGELGTSAAVLLRALIDLAAERPELLEEVRPAVEDETRALRRRRQD